MLCFPVGIIYIRNWRTALLHACAKNALHTPVNAYARQVFFLDFGSPRIFSFSLSSCVHVLHFFNERRCSRYGYAGEVGVCVAQEAHAS